MKNKINEKNKEEGLPSIPQIVNLRPSEKTIAIEVTDMLACPPHILEVSCSDIENARKIRNKLIAEWFKEQSRNRFGTAEETSNHSVILLKPLSGTMSSRCCNAIILHY